MTPAQDLTGTSETGEAALAHRGSFAVTGLGLCDALALQSAIDIAYDFPWEASNAE